jgi:xanthine dehydrogenase accessory factor
MDEIYQRILDLSRQGGEAVLVTVVHKEGSTPALPGTKMLVCAEGMSLGTVGGGELERVARIKASELLQARESQLIRYALLEGEQVSETGDDEALPMWCGGRVTLFYEHLGYDTYVYLFGAGHVGSAIAAHLRNLKCYVTVIDNRPEVMAQLPPVNRRIIGDYESALADEQVPQGAYFVIGTPAHAADYEVLKAVMSGGWAPRYVGMLGSRRKSQELIRRLVDELGSAIDLSVLYTPVGLDIGGASPDEIAISIIAEIQALRYGKSGHNHMRSANPLLRPSDG